MIRPAIFATLVLAIAATVPLASETAMADRYRRDRYYHDRDYHDRWRHEYRNYRDARRAGVAAAVVTGAVVESAAHDRAQERYRECVYATGYDYACDRQRYEDEYRSRRAARRAGVIVGATTHAIVRD